MFGEPWQPEVPSVAVTSLRARRRGGSLVAMSLGVALVLGATVAVTVVPAPTMPVRIDHATGTFTCSAPSCVVELDPGRYRVRAGTRDQLVSIEGPTILESRAARPTTRTVTLVLGIVGSAAALAGQVGWVVSFQRDAGARDGRSLRRATHGLVPPRHPRHHGGDAELDRLRAVGRTAPRASRAAHRRVRRPGVRRWPLRAGRRVLEAGARGRVDTGRSRWPLGRS